MHTLNTRRFARWFVKLHRSCPWDGFLKPPLAFLPSFPFRFRGRLRYFSHRPSSPRAPLLRRRYPPSQLLLAHAQTLAPPPSFRFVPYSQCPRRLRHPRLVTRASPDFQPALLSWSAAPPVPSARQVHLTSSSLTTSVFTLARRVRLPQNPTNGFSWVSLSTRQAFLYVAALQFACPPVRSHRLCREPVSPLFPPRGTRDHTGSTPSQHTRAFPLELSVDSLPSSTVEYATRPTGRLPGLDLHQQEKQPRRLHRAARQFSEVVDQTLKFSNAPADKAR